MFTARIGDMVPEVSHKRIESPTESVYYNHIHNHCEILLFVSGEADYNVDGRIFRPKPYDLLLIPAATYHYLIPTASVPYENYVVGIDPAFIDGEHYERLFGSPLMIGIEDDEELKGFFGRLDLYRERYSDGDFETCALAVIRELVTYCSYRRDELRAERNTNHTHVEEIVRYISEHLEENLDADRIARHFLLSKSYVQNLFSNTMHIGMKQYILQKKIYAAHGELSNGKSPGEVSELYGFGDYSSFYRQYKRTFGVSPCKRK